MDLDNKKIQTLASDFIASTEGATWDYGIITGLGTEEKTVDQIITQVTVTIPTESSIDKTIVAKAFNEEVKKQLKEKFPSSYQNYQSRYYELVMSSGNYTTPGSIFLCNPKELEPIRKMFQTHSIQDHDCFDLVHTMIEGEKEWRDYYLTRSLEQWDAGYSIPREDWAVAIDGALSSSFLDWSNSYAKAALAATVILLGGIALFVGSATAITVGAFIALPLALWGVGSSLIHLGMSAKNYFKASYDANRIKEEEAIFEMNQSAVDLIGSVLMSMESIGPIVNTLKPKPPVEVPSSGKPPSFPGDEPPPPSGTTPLRRALEEIYTQGEYEEFACLANSSGENFVILKKNKGIHDPSSYKIYAVIKGELKELSTPPSNLPRLTDAGLVEIPTSKGVFRIPPKPSEMVPVELLGFSSPQIYPPLQQVGADVPKSSPRSVPLPEAKPTQPGPAVSPTKPGGPPPIPPGLGEKVSGTPLPLPPPPKGPPLASAPPMAPPPLPEAKPTQPGPVVSPTNKPGGPPPIPPGLGEKVSGTPLPLPPPPKGPPLASAPPMAPPPPVRIPKPSNPLGDPLIIKGRRPPPPPPPRKK